MSKKPVNPLAAKRHKARHYAMQALYQWHMAGAPLNHIEAEFRTEYDFDKVDGEYFHILLHEIPAQLDDVEAAFSPYMVERSLEELDPIERALLRIGTFELKERIDVPYKVVINEAVNLAKKFGASESHKFINGVLDQVAQQLRSVEVNAESRS
ncbi:MAG: transcription antitermination factor NusB [Halieaceae bacterium]|nr:transcription antitermination factor NusB [Halieaceae bacterium]